MDMEISSRRCLAEWVEAKTEDQRRENQCSIKSRLPSKTFLRVRQPRLRSTGTESALIAKEEEARMEPMLLARAAEVAV